MADHAPVVIRPLEAADLEAAVSLFAAVAAEGRYVGGEAPVDRDARRQRLVVALDSKGDTSFVAEADGELVGHVQVVLRNGLADLGILVASGWRGRGIGSQLMARSLAWCKDNNAHKVTLSVWPHNTAAIAMYEKFGFVEEGRLRRHYRRRNGELWDAISMGLVLDEVSPGSAGRRTEASRPE